MGEIIVTTKEALQNIVFESVKNAVKQAKKETKELSEKYIDENEAMSFLFVKDKRTLHKRVKKYNITTYFADNKKVYKEQDIKSLINKK